MDADTLGVRAAAGPSEWATQNLAADTAAGLPAPAPAAGPGVAAGALPALSYAIEVEVTSTATGDALAPGLSWGPGEQHTLDASVDTPACYSLPCSVRISSFDDPDTAAVRIDRAGVVRVGDGRMAVTLERQVQCLDATGNVARVVGSSTIAADLAVLEATYDPVTGRWNATSLEGSGTASVIITDPTCETGASPPAPARTTCGHRHRHLSTWSSSLTAGIRGERRQTEDQTASRMASPWPPPPHRAAAPRPPPRRLSSCSSVRATRVPDMPTG